MLYLTNLTKSQDLSEPQPAYSPSSSEFLFLSLARLLLASPSFSLFLWPLLPPPFQLFALVPAREASKDRLP